MTVLSGATVVLPDRVLDPGTVAIDDGRIVEVRAGRRAHDTNTPDLTGHVLVPGFIDVHVHGVEGEDTLASAAAVAAMGRRLTKYGVTGFCPTSVACGPLELRRLLEAIRAAWRSRAPGTARVLPAHLESNFINEDFRGAQPLSCLRRPTREPRPGAGVLDPFSGQDVLDVIAQCRAEVGIMTVAPEIEGGLDLIQQLSSAGHIISLGHSGATFEEGLAGVEAGARHATHLFNRMPPLAHRAPGLIGAVFDRPQVRAEIVCDGYHVHPVVVRAAIAALGRNRTMAITDGTAGSGLPVGTEVPLGSHTIIVRKEAAFLADGTLSGSTLTMDGAFRLLVQRVGLSLVDAAYVCATTAAAQLGLSDRGRLEVGLLADLVVLDRNLQVTRTYVEGVESPR
jgi:N-acetylglucosamine-6-phosphate deacetylase